MQYLNLKKKRGLRQQSDKSETVGESVYLRVSVALSDHVFQIKAFLTVLQWNQPSQVCTISTMLQIQHMHCNENLPFSEALFMFL